LQQLAGVKVLQIELLCLRLFPVIIHETS
jgi:hypothetical protein